MSLEALVLGGLAAAGALALTPWARRLAGADSRWFRLHVHVPLAAVGGVLAAGLSTGWAEALAFTSLAVASGVLVVVDLTVHRLPDAVVGRTYLVLLPLLTVAAATQDAWRDLGRACAAGAAVTALYFVLALISPSGMGLGDVKLSGALAAFLGWFGWPEVLLGTLAAFVLGGLSAVVLLALRRAHRDTAFAFGPWMILGTWWAAATGGALLGLA